MAPTRNAAPRIGRGRRRTVQLTSVVALLALPVAVSCGDDDTADPEAVGSTEAAEAAGATEGDTNAAEIVIADFTFTGPSSVPVGTTVIVRNDDATEHSWTSADGGFTSGTLAGGDTFSFTFTEAGEFTYTCAFHPSMTGTITVTE